jgi:methyl-accepting chemotaxis protein
MTTDTVLIERALIVMAIAMSVQTLLFVGAAIGAFIAWRKASLAFEETRNAMNEQIAHLRQHVDRVSDVVEEVAGTVRRGSTAVGEVVTDVREAIGTVGNGLNSVASVVTAPRAAMALGVLRGIKAWRRHRSMRRAEAALAEI